MFPTSKLNNGGGRKHYTPWEKAWARTATSEAVLLHDCASLRWLELGAGCLCTKLFRTSRPFPGRTLRTAAWHAFSPASRSNHACTHFHSPGRASARERAGDRRTLGHVRLDQSKACIYFLDTNIMHRFYGLCYLFAAVSNSRMATHRELHWSQTEKDEGRPKAQHQQPKQIPRTTPQHFCE